MSPDGFDSLHGEVLTGSGMRFALALDKFKGTLTAWEACEGARLGLSEVFPGAVFTQCPIADGGEGTVDALAAFLGSRGERISISVENAVASREVEAAYLLDRSEPEMTTAIVEMAAASGLALLSPEERDPLRATTYGTGLVMRDALKRGAGRVVVGVGGSATNDGGLGLARAFGHRFSDACGNEIRVPEDLPNLVRVACPDHLPEVEVTVLADVTNPLLGPNGATAVYGHQKGVTEVSAPVLEQGLEGLAEVVARDLGTNQGEAPGAGAAGGLAFGLMSFLGASVVSGFDYVSRRVGLEDSVSEADVVVTGEGRMDRQTLSGKGPAGVAALARKHGKRVAALCGAVDPAAAAVLREAFPVMAVMAEEVGEREALSSPGKSLWETSRRLGDRLAIALG